MEINKNNLINTSDYSSVETKSKRRKRRIKELLASHVSPSEISDYRIYPERYTDREVLKVINSNLNNRSRGNLIKNG